MSENHKKLTLEDILKKALKSLNFKEKAEADFDEFADWCYEKKLSGAQVGLLCCRMMASLLDAGFIDRETVERSFKYIMDTPENKNED